MQAIALDKLITVTGGASSLSTQITSLSATVTDYKNASSGSSSNNLLLPVMFMALNNRRQQPSVVSTPGATVVSY